MLSLADTRAFLEEAARRKRLVTYRDIATVLEASPPNVIHQVTVALERLMQQDAAAGRPFIAALAVSATLDDMPQRGFFDCAARLGRFAGDPDGPDAKIFHANEVQAVFTRLGAGFTE